MNLFGVEKWNDAMLAYTEFFGNEKDAWRELTWVRMIFYSKNKIPFNTFIIDLNTSQTNELIFQLRKRYGELKKEYAKPTKTEGQ